MPDDMDKPLIRDRGPRLQEASQTEPGSPLVGILGSGDFSRSLARRLVASGFQVVVGSRSPTRSASLFPEEVEVVSQSEAACRAELLFVAVFPEHYSTLLQLHQPLKGKVLVDVSNGLRLRQDGPSHAESLAATFPESHVVKGFNTVSAWSLQRGPRDASRQVFLCSDSGVARSTVSHLCRRMGFVPVDMGLLSASLQVENMPLYLFPSWRVPVLLSFSLFMVFYLYNFLRDVVHPFTTAGKNTFYKMPVELVNVTLPCVALLMLTAVYVPGVWAAFLQLWWGTKYRRFPDFLDKWLQQRKQFGLCSFMCAVLHMVYSLSLPMRKSARYKMLDLAFKQVKAGQEESWVEEEVWRMELYVSVGIMAVGLLSLLAVTSLPSVANAVNWREFSFIQSCLGLGALFLATLHTSLYGWTRAWDPQHYPFYLPPPFLLVVLPPAVLLLLRSLLLLPYVSLRLGRIRRGWEKSRHIRFTLPQDDCGNGLEDISRV